MRTTLANEPVLLHELIAHTAARAAEQTALTYGQQHLSYSQLCQQMLAWAAGLAALKLPRGTRVGIFLEKRFETVVASFGTAAAGLVFVPINPLLKPLQVRHILEDCTARLLLTSDARWQTLAPEVASLSSLQHLVLVDDCMPTATAPTPQACHSWSDLLRHPAGAGHRVIDTDTLSILYTSGSTGRPKGVVLSHRNMVVGAKSVASYLGNGPQDTLLAALPLSFDAGFSQLTTAFYSGSRAVLLNYLLPRDVLQALERERVTGLTAVPPLYMQLCTLRWPAAINQHLRYFANTGGRMPRETLAALRERVPAAKPFLMYGLTEAFRSTYLPPEEVDRRPDSIGKAIPNAEILVLREDGTECDADEPGELVHRGALVGQGYWNDPQKTAERYRPLPAGVAAREAGLVLPELAVFSGDTVRRDAEGFLYFVGRRDEMIKTSGYRVSPTEVEEALYATRMVGECVAFGVDHPTLGQAVRAIVTASDGAQGVDLDALLAECRRTMPAYMVPEAFDVQPGPLPRNPNGKIDRNALASAWKNGQSA